MQRLARDSFLSIILHVAPRLASVVMFVLIGQRLGTSAAGVFVLANTFLVLTTTVLMGLDEIVVREVARRPPAVRAVFVQFSLLRLALAGLAACLVWAAVTLFFDYPASTTRAIQILVVSVVPDGLTQTAQAVLVGQRRFGMTALVSSGIGGLKVFSGAAVLWAGQGLELLVLLWLAGSVLGALILVSLTMLRTGVPQWRDWLDHGPVRDNWRAALALLGSTLLLAFESQTDTLVLSKVRSEAEVAWYGAATTIAFGLLLLSQGYRLSVYPVMAGYALEAPSRLAQLYGQSMRFIAMVALPISLGLALAAPHVIQFIFGPEFAPAAPALRILGLAFLVMFLYEPGSRMMIVADKQDRLLSFLVITTAANIMLNLLLTPRFGATGAALARVGSASVLFLCIFSYVATRLTRIDLWAMTSTSVLAGIVMAMVAWILRALPFPIGLAAGAVSYVVFILIFDRSLYSSVRATFLPGKDRP